MSLWRRGGIWWYDFTVRGVRQRGSTRTGNKDLALECERRAVEAVENPEHPIKFWKFIRFKDSKCFDYDTEEICVYGLPGLEAAQDDNLRAMRKEFSKYRLEKLNYKNSEERKDRLEWHKGKKQLSAIRKYLKNDLNV